MFCLEINLFCQRSMHDFIGLGVPISQITSTGNRQIEWPKGCQNIAEEINVASFHHAGNEILQQWKGTTTTPPNAPTPSLLIPARALGRLLGYGSEGSPCPCTSGLASLFQKAEIKWKNICLPADVIIRPGLTSVLWRLCQVCCAVCQFCHAHAGCRPGCKSNVVYLGTNNLYFSLWHIPPIQHLHLREDILVAVNRSI